MAAERPCILVLRGDNASWEVSRRPWDLGRIDDLEHPALAFPLGRNGRAISNS